MPSSEPLPPPSFFPSMEEKSGNGGEMQASTSFTALLGLPSSSAMELLQEMERNHHKLLAGSPPISAPQKRKKASHKDNASGKRTKNGDGGGEEEKLPYVHVRARRGQATDSHSLAERARREKINARMKLLQDLVPGCSKVSGTAQVLDEIINHVQSLQRQVEFLSMRLAAVNPSGMELGGIDSFLSASGGTAWMEQPQRQVRLADLLPKSYGKSVVFFSGNPNSTAAL